PRVPYPVARAHRLPLRVPDRHARDGAPQPSLRWLCGVAGRHPSSGERGDGGRSTGQDHGVRDRSPAAARRALPGTDRTGLRGADRRRERARERPRRQHHQGKEAHQHPLVHLGRGRPPDPAPDHEPRAGARVDPRGRAARDHAEVAAPQEEVARRPPPLLAPQPARLVGADRRRRGWSTPPWAAAVTPSRVPTDPECDGLSCAQMAPPAPHIGPVLLKGCTETGYTSGDTRPYYGVAAETTSRRCYPGNVMNTPGRASEVIFLVEEAPEGGYTARALGESIFTEA